MRTKPKILLLVTLSEWGGAQQVVHSLARGLSERFDITVACASGGELVAKLKRAGINVVAIPALRRNPNPLDLLAFIKIYALLHHEKFDIVHIHSTKAGLLGRLAARLARVPAVLFTAHGWAFTEGRSLWKRHLLALMECFAARFCTRIICVSEHDRQLALKFKVARHATLAVIHNGVDPRPFLQADGTKIRRQLDLEGVAVLTFVGRLAPPKDPFTLLKACTFLDGDFKVLLVGEGPLRTAAARLARQNGLSDKVILTGARHDVPDILAASDAFVLPSRWEGLPLTVIEAMMAGLPVVASRVGGVSELVDEGVTGFLVPPSDPKALARALKTLLEDESLRRRMGQAGRAKALEHFTLELMLRRTQTLYEDLLGSAG